MIILKLKTICFSILIPASDDKKRARLNCIRHFLTELDYPGKDINAIGSVDDLIVLKPQTQFKDSTDTHID